MKSLRITGSRQALRAARKSSSLPPKNSRSVSTDKHAAPLSWYEAAICAGSRSARMSPTGARPLDLHDDGRLARRDLRAKGPLKPLGASASRASRSTASIGRRSRASAISRRLTSRMRVEGCRPSQPAFARPRVKATRLVQLGAGGSGGEGLPGELHAVRKARHDARDVQRRRGIEDDDVARGAGLVGQHREHAGP